MKLRSGMVSGSTLGLSVAGAYGSIIRDDRPIAFACTKS